MQGEGCWVVSALQLCDLGQAMWYQSMSLSIDKMGMCYLPVRLRGVAGSLRGVAGNAMRSCVDKLCEESGPVVQKCYHLHHVRPSLLPDVQTGRAVPQTDHRSKADNFHASHTYFDLKFYGGQTPPPPRVSFTGMREDATQLCHGPKGKPGIRKLFL